MKQWKKFPINLVENVVEKLKITPNFETKNQSLKELKEEIYNEINFYLSILTTNYKLNGLEVVSNLLKHFITKHRLINGNKRLLSLMMIKLNSYYLKTKPTLEFYNSNLIERLIKECQNKNDDEIINDLKIFIEKYFSNKKTTTNKQHENNLLNELSLM